MLSFAPKFALCASNSFSEKRVTLFAAQSQKRFKSEELIEKCGGYLKELLLFYASNKTTESELFVWSDFEKKTAESSSVVFEIANVLYSIASLYSTAGVTAFVEHSYLSSASAFMKSAYLLSLLESLLSQHKSFIIISPELDLSKFHKDSMLIQAYHSYAMSELENGTSHINCVKYFLYSCFIASTLEKYTSDTHCSLQRIQHLSIIGMISEAFALGVEGGHIEEQQKSKGAFVRTIPTMTLLETAKALSTYAYRKTMQMKLSSNLTELCKVAMNKFQLPATKPNPTAAKKEYSEPLSTFVSIDYNETVMNTADWFLGVKFECSSILEEIVKKFAFKIEIEKPKIELPKVFTDRNPIQNSSSLPAIHREQSNSETKELNVAKSEPVLVSEPILVASSFFQNPLTENDVLKVTASEANVLIANEPKKHLEEFILIDKHIKLSLSNARELKEFLDLFVSFRKNCQEEGKALARKSSKMLVFAQNVFTDHSLSLISNSVTKQLEGFISDQAELTAKANAIAGELDWFYKEHELKRKRLINDALVLHRDITALYASVDAPRLKYLKTARKCHKLSLQPKKFKELSLLQGELEKCDKLYCGTLEAMKDRQEMYYSKELPKLREEFHELYTEMTKFFKKKFEELGNEFATYAYKAAKSSNVILTAVSQTPFPQIVVTENAPNLFHESFSPSDTSLNRKMSPHKQDEHIDIDKTLESIKKHTSEQLSCEPTVLIATEKTHRLLGDDVMKNVSKKLAENENEETCKDNSDHTEVKKERSHSVSTYKNSEENESNEKSITNDNTSTEIKETSKKPKHRKPKSKKKHSKLENNDNDLDRNGEKENKEQPNETNSIENQEKDSRPIRAMKMEKYQPISPQKKAVVLEEINETEFSLNPPLNPPSNPPPNDTKTDDIKTRQETENQQTSQPNKPSLQLRRPSLGDVPVVPPKPNHLKLRD